MEVRKTVIVDEEAGPPRAVGRAFRAPSSWSVGLAMTIGIAILCAGSFGLGRHHMAVLRPEGIVQFEENMVADVIVEKAKLAKEAERFDDMASYMKTLVEMKGNGLIEEERNLFSDAYKNVVGAKRSAWKIIFMMEEKKREESDESSADLAGNYRKKIEAELLDACNEVFKLIDEASLGSEDPEAVVFFLKMKADYFRYVTEISTGEDRDTAATNSETAYKEASLLADELPATNPIRLGLALNYSVFWYEIKNDGTKACELAKSAFDAAMSELDSVKEDSMKESTLIMQLLRDNLTLWTSEPNGETENDYE